MNRAFERLDEPFRTVKDIITYTLSNLIILYVYTSNESRIHRKLRWFSDVLVRLENISLTWGRRRLIFEIRSITIKHKETLTLSVKGCNFRHILGNYYLLAGRDLYRATPAVKRGLGFCGLIRRNVPI